MRARSTFGQNVEWSRALFKKRKEKKRKEKKKKKKTQLTSRK